MSFQSMLFAFLREHNTHLPWSCIASWRAQSNNKVAVYWPQQIRLICVAAIFQYMTCIEQSAVPCFPMCSFNISLRSKVAGWVALARGNHNSIKMLVPISALNVIYAYYLISRHFKKCLLFVWSIFYKKLSRSKHFQQCLNSSFLLILTDNLPLCSGLIT